MGETETNSEVKEGMTIGSVQVQFQECSFLSVRPDPLLNS